MENVMDDFHASSPEQRGSPNPNVVHVPFDAMKERIVKIVDGYSGWGKRCWFNHEIWTMSVSKLKVTQVISFRLYK